METYAQIKTNLKNLRLPSFSENLELRIEEAIETKMSYADFLLILTQDEVDRRKHRKRENTIKKAGLGKFKTMLEFDFDFNPQINRRKIMDLNTCDFINANKNILFVGPTGVGNYVKLFLM